MAWNDENIGPSITGEVDAALVSLGQRGFVYLSDTDQVSGNFAAIQSVDSAELASLTTAGTSCQIGGLATTVLPTGTIIYGPFTYVMLASGKAIAYRA
jgi:ABC-type transporter Mla MlaB component